MCPQKLSSGQCLLNTGHFSCLLIFRTFPQQASLQAPICNVCMTYQETSLKRDISLRHGILSGKLSAVLQAVKGRSVTIQELPHSKTAEANSKNSLSQPWTKVPANIREPYSVRRASFQIRLSSKVIWTLAIKWHFVLTLILVSWPHSSSRNNVLPT